MTTETMTIHRALAELKVLENRINKTISDAKFCAAVKQSMKKVNGVSLLKILRRGPRVLSIRFVI